MLDDAWQKKSVSRVLREDLRKHVGERGLIAIASGTLKFSQETQIGFPVGITEVDKMILDHSTQQRDEKRDSPLNKARHHHKFVRISFFQFFFSVSQLFFPLFSSPFLESCAISGRIATEGNCKNEQLKDVLGHKLGDFAKAPQIFSTKTLGGDGNHHPVSQSTIRFFWGVWCFWTKEKKPSHNKPIVSDRIGPFSITNWSQRPVERISFNRTICPALLLFCCPLFSFQNLLFFSFSKKGKILIMDLVVLGGLKRSYCTKSNYFSQVLSFVNFK